MSLAAVTKLQSPPAEVESSRRAERFTLDGSDALERRISGICEEVNEQLSRAISASRLEAILLAGGYGRGEGGMLRTPLGEELYNDMEFYLFLRGNRFLNERRFGLVLHEIAEAISRQTGIDIEFKVLSFARLRRAEPSMFYYDLVMGHRWLAGHETLLTGCEHHRHAESIPASEATRLLMNRCSGLLFAREQLLGETWTGENADFVARNIAKARLAFGDALLAAGGQYHWSCRERNRRVHELDLKTSWLDELRHHHDCGVEFKLHPVKSASTRDFLEERHEQAAHFAEQLWLWLENRRLGTSFKSVREYTWSETNKFSGSSRARNVLTNLKAGNRKDLLRNPRERILNALPLLLWESTSDPLVLARVQQILATSAANFPDLVAAYRGLWKRFN